MIKEAYVSFEVAKLLKEKGFPQDPDICNTAYTWKGKMSNNAKSFMPNIYSIIPSRCYFIAPTLQMAIQWLRRVKNIYVQVDLDSWALGTHSGYYIVIQSTNSGFEEISPCEQVFFDEPEEAVEAAIKYCLENLI